jgi:hypothetical protein
VLIQGFFGFWYFVVLVVVVLGFELMTYTLSHSTSLYFVMGFFKVGSHKLFAQVGFEP